MTVPTYFFPNSALKAQSAAVAVWATGNDLAVPVWTEKAVYSFNGSYFIPLTLPASVATPPANPNNARDGHGFYGAAGDGVDGLWLSAGGGQLAYLPTSNPSSGFAVTLDPTEAITGLVVTGVAASGNTAIAVNAAGQVILASSATPGTSAILSPGFAQLARGASVDATHLYTTLPVAGSLGLMTLSGRSFSSVSTPMAMPGILAASASGVAVGGWSYASVASGITALQASPLSPSTQLAIAQASTVSLLSGMDPVWTTSAQATGLTSVSALAWNPDGSQILASVSGGVVVLGVLEGNLIIDQNLSVANAAAIALTSDGTNALVCEPGSNQVGVLVNDLDLWSVGTPFAITEPIAVLTTGVTTGWVLSGSNLYPLTRSGDAWTPGIPLALGFTGAALGADAYGNIYATGGSGTSGYLAMVASGNIVATESWSGAGHGISLAFEIGQCAVLLSDNQTIRAFGAYADVLYPQGVMSLTAPTGCSFLGSSPSSVWLAGSSALWQCQWTKPYSIRRYKNGVVSVYQDSAWGSATLGIWHDPSALAWDASGNVWVATAENDLYSFSGTVSDAVIALLSHTVVPDYAGQVAGVMLGISSMVWWNGGLYATTLFPGALVGIAGSIG